MNNGWVKIHRKMLSWEWWDDHNTFRLFVYLLLSANHKDNRWRGILVKKGELITSVRKLAKITSLSVRSVRTSLQHLKSTQELTHLKNTKYTHLRVNNWDSYQSIDTLADKSPTHDRHTTDTRPTTNKNVKNVKNVKKYVSKDTSRVSTRRDIDNLYEFYINQTGSREKLSPLRRQKIQRRLKELGLDGCKRAIVGALGDPFYSGENDRGWRANLDYIFRSFENTERLSQLSITSKANEPDTSDPLVRLSLENI